MKAVIQRVHHGIQTAAGEFQAMIEVRLVNDSPITILLDSRENI